MTFRLSDIISPAFYKTHHYIKSDRYNEYVEYGGRGSAKSSFFGIEVLLLILRNPEIHALVMRRYANTMRSTVYAQIVWAIGELGLSGAFKCTVSPMEITRTSTGQKILFFGADDPGKLKSLKFQFGYAGILWLEELDQFDGPAAVRNIEQSVLRGGEKAYLFKSFNPPITRDNWANQYVLEDKPGMYAHRSTYLTTPQEWLGPKFIADAEYLKEQNPKAYEHEYLGIAVGTGGSVFENIKAESLTDEQCIEFDRPLHGVDWGYYPDPFAYNRCYYDHARRVLYVYDELTAYKAGNADTARMLREEKGLTEDDFILADSAEPKSIGDYKDYGFFIRGVKKGKDSVDYSFKWLQSLSAIIIDKQRCPDTYKEFIEYEYERDKDNNILSRYPDKNNHHIDAVRYATNQIWRIKGQ